MTEVSAHMNSTGASKQIRHLQRSLVYLPQLKIIYFPITIVKKTNLSQPSGQLELF